MYACYCIFLVFMIEYGCSLGGASHAQNIPLLTREARLQSICHIMLISYAWRIERGTIGLANDS